MVRLFIAPLRPGDGPCLSWGEVIRWQFSAFTFRVFVLCHSARIRRDLRHRLAKLERNDVSVANGRSRFEGDEGFMRGLSFGARAAEIDSLVQIGSEGGMPGSSRLRWTNRSQGIRWFGDLRFLRFSYFLIFYFLFSIFYFLIFIRIMGSTQLMYWMTRPSLPPSPSKIRISSGVFRVASLW